MHNGFHVLDVAEDSAAAVIGRLDTAGELAYGADWHIREGSAWVGSCTFYDHQMQLWKHC